MPRLRIKLIAYRENKEGDAVINDSVQVDRVRACL